MILDRLGNKSAIAKYIIPHFPSHKIWIEPFFGAGGMFFNKPLAKYSIVNDSDSDVFNLFSVVKDQIEKLQFLFNTMPMSEELFYYWMKHKETDQVKKALRFLFVSCYSYLGKSDTFKLLHSNVTHKQKLEYLLLECSKYFKTTTFRNKDFRDFFNGIQDDDTHIGKKHRFIYCDWPYLGKTHNYENGFKEEDVVDCLNILEDTGIKFACSEFNHPFILKEAKHRGLNVIHICKRQSMKKKEETEILLTNYEKEPTLFQI